MGVSGPGIFANDIACDVRDHYRELIEDGIDDAEAMRQTFEKYRQYFDDPDDGTAAILGLAVTQSKIGRLDPSIRDRALAVIDQGGDLDAWERESPMHLGKRKPALEKARAQLIGPQPARKRLKPPKRFICDLVAGDVLALDLPGGPVLLRTVCVRSNRYGDTPTLEELEFNGSGVPPAEIIRDLPAKKDNPFVDSTLEARFEAMFDARDAGWKEAGFRKVANIPAREGDERGAGVQIGGDTGIFSISSYFWSALARKYHRRSDA